MSRVHLVARHASRILLTAGVLALAYAAYLAIDSHMFQATERRQFELARQSSPVVAAPVVAAPVVAVVADGDSIGVIEIPRIGVAVVMVQGDSPDILKRAVGHIADTALPGDAGNVVLAGHRDTFFRSLRDLRVGDAIALKTRQGDFDYVVESTFVVAPTDVWVLDARGGHTLTLITCYPFSYIGPAPDRFIVRAREATDSAAVTHKAARDVS
jgi:sortase A